MNTLVIKTQEAVTDTTLRKLDELIVQVTKSGDGSGYSSWVLYSASVGVILTIPANGSFYSDIVGTINLGSTITIVTTGNQAVYFKVNANTQIRIENSSSVLILNTFTVGDVVNSPTVSVSLSQLKYLTSMSQIWGNFFTGDLSNTLNMTALGFYALSGATEVSGNPAILTAKSAVLNYLSIGGTGMRGTLDSLSNCILLNSINTDGSGSLLSINLPNLVTLVNLTNLNLRTINANGSFNSLATNLTKLSTFNLSFGVGYPTGDISLFRNTITLTSINLYGYSSGLTFENSTGWEATAFHDFSISCALNTTQTDNMLIALAAATWQGATGTCVVFAPNCITPVGVSGRSAAAAITILQGKGVEVTLHA